MKCPGQDSRYWKPGAIFEVKCPNCGELIEFFKDDTRRKCPGCGQEVPNPEMDFGCAAYCPYAEQCLGGLGTTIGGEGKIKILKGKMLRQIHQLYQDQSKKVAKATNFLELCEELGKKEGAELGLILLAGLATLFCQMESGAKDLSPKELKRVEERLLETGADETQATDAIKLVEKGMAGQIKDAKDIKNFNVIRDASAIADFEAKAGRQWQSLYETLLTDSGRQLVKNKAALA